jgi:hypothetical protein
MATWVIRSKTSHSRRRKISFHCLPTQEGWCTIRSRHQQTHAWITLFSCDGVACCMASMVTHLRRLKKSCWDALSSRLTRWTKPLGTALPLSTLTELGRSKSELIAENVLLRQQSIILKRQVKRPVCTNTDHLLLVLLARLVHTWQQAHITRVTRHEARAGIGSSFACTGNARQRPMLTSPRSLPKRLP